MRTNNSKLIESNLGLVHSCVRRYTGRGIDYDELYSAACIGIVKAAGGFDSSRGLRFSTYAVPVILGEIKQLFRTSGAVKVSRELASLSMRANVEGRAFAEKHGREPHISELAALLNVSIEDAAQAVCACQRPVSLSAQDGDNDSPIELPVQSFENRLIEHTALRDAIDGLPESDRAIVNERYFNGRTQQATAALLGMTQVQVSRREKRILAVLRESMRE